MQNAPRGAFCNTFDLHKAIIGLEIKSIFSLLRVAVLDRFYCTAFLCKAALVEQNDLNLSDILVLGQENRYFSLVLNEMGLGLRQARYGISTSHL